MRQRSHQLRAEKKTSTNSALLIRFPSRIHSCKVRSQFLLPLCFVVVALCCCVFGLAQTFLNAAAVVVDLLFVPFASPFRHVLWMIAGSEKSEVLRALGWRFLRCEGEMIVNRGR
jgi:hypothetical protein